MNKTLATVLKTAAYILGLPVIAAFAFYKSMPIYRLNPSYQPYILAGLGLILLVGILYIIAAAVTGALTKRGKGIGATVALVVFSLVLTAGIWFGIDRYGAGVVGDATQYTLSYDDYKDNYAEKAEIHSELLTGFIEMNIKNGRLNPDKAKLYRSQGYMNEDVRSLILNSYDSMTEAYSGYSGLLINFASGGRMTVPVMIHLLFDGKNSPSASFNGYTGEGRGEDGKDRPIGWTILDMQEGAITFTIDASMLDLGIDGLTEALVPILFADGGVMAELIAGLEDGVEAVLGAPVYILVDYNQSNITVSLKPSAETRGVYDYKNMAWLSNNQLLVALLSVFPVRDAFYMLGSLLIISSLFVGIVRIKEYSSGKQKRGGKER